MAHTISDKLNYPTPAERNEQNAVKKRWNIYAQAFAEHTDFNTKVSKTTTTTTAMS